MRKTLEARIDTLEEAYFDLCELQHIINVNLDRNFVPGLHQTAKPFLKESEKERFGRIVPRVCNDVRHQIAQISYGRADDTQSERLIKRLDRTIDKIKPLSAAYREIIAQFSLVDLDKEEREAILDAVTRSSSPEECASILATQGIF